MLFGKNVSVKTHGCDRYGRILGDVFLPDGRSLNQELVKNGFAWWFGKYSNDEKLAKLEGEAKAAKGGLWADLHAITPCDYRKNCRR